MINHHTSSINGLFSIANGQKVCQRRCMLSARHGPAFFRRSWPELWICTRWFWWQRTPWLVLLFSGVVGCCVDEWLVGWLVGWLIGVCWLVGWLAGWLAGWLVGWFVRSFVRWSVLVGWSVGVGWLVLVDWCWLIVVGWLVLVDWCWLIGVGWLVLVDWCWLIGVGWLVGWLVGVCWLVCWWLLNCQPLAGQNFRHEWLEHGRFKNVVDKCHEYQDV